jgi:hypothetical protein
VLPVESDKSQRLDESTAISSDNERLKKALDVSRLLKQTPILKMGDDLKHTYTCEIVDTKKLKSHSLSPAQDHSLNSERLLEVFRHDKYEYG